jgi:hypothetical protein
MEAAQIIIRPFRFVFLIEPKDKKNLLRTFEVTSSLWGGSFNFIVLLFKTVPKRYRQEYQKSISAKTMLNGFVEAFQPDYIVESRDGHCREYGIDFPEKRTTSFTELMSRDELGRCKIGVASPGSACFASFGPAHRPIRIQIEAVCPYLHNLATEDTFRTVLLPGLVPAHEPLRVISPPNVKAAAVVAWIGDDHVALHLSD